MVVVVAIMNVAVDIIVVVVVIVVIAIVVTVVVIIVDAIVVVDDYDVCEHTMWQGLQGAAKESVERIESGGRR